MEHKFFNLLTHFFGVKVAAITMVTIGSIGALVAFLFGLSLLHKTHWFGIAVFGATIGYFLCIAYIYTKVLDSMER
jgi:hypothetical protein